MLRKASEAVSEGNGPIPRQEEYGSGQLTLADALRETREKLDEFHDEMTGFFEQFSAGLEQFLEQDARQRRCAMKAEDTNTRDYDVIHVDSDHQRHFILDYQPKNTRLCFALLDTNLFY